MIRKFLLISFSFLYTLSATAQTARVQFANNCADVGTNALDVYVDGVLVLDNLMYRSATPFMDVPATGPVVVSIAPENSMSAGNAFYTATYILQPHDTVIAIANGLVNTAGYNPAKPFSLDTIMGAREYAYDPNNDDIVIMNGSTDLSTVDFRSGTSTFIDDLAYGKRSAYRETAFGSYTFRISNSTGSKSYNTYKLSLGVLGVPGQSAVLITSGFKDPSQNNMGPFFQPMLIPSIGGTFIPLSATVPEAYARLQLIHNSADKLLDSVDVYVDGNKEIDNMPFRTATAFRDVTVNASTDIGIAPKNSTSAADIFYTKTIKFDSAKTYIMTLNGIQSSSGYTPAPTVSADVFGNAREEGSSATQTDVLFMHGSTDLPTVDINNGTSTVVNDISYGGYNPYVSMAPQNYIFTVVDGSNNELVKYKAQLLGAGLAGKATTLLFSGFKNPSANSNGAAYGLYYSSALGGPLVPFAVSTGVADPGLNNNAIAVWPNPAQDILYIRSAQALQEAAIYDMAGKKLAAIEDVNTPTDIRGLTNGVYMIRIVADGETTYRKFVKE